MDNNVENDVGENEGIEEQTAWRPDPLKLKVQSLNMSEAGTEHANSRYRSLGH